MKIKVTVQKDSAAAKVIEASKAEKEAFKQFVQSGRATNKTSTKLEKVATAPI